jgi:hypothetical protein
MGDDLTKYRIQRHSENLERFEARLLESAAQLKLYRQAHDREPESMDAVRLWALTALGNAVDPYEILTREEIAQLWEDAEYPSFNSY